MIIIGVLDRALDALGLIYFGITLWKIAKGYPVSRWFF